MLIFSTEDLSHAAIMELGVRHFLTVDYFTTVVSCRLGNGNFRAHGVVVEISKGSFQRPLTGIILVVGYLRC